MAFSSILDSWQAAGADDDAGSCRSALDAFKAKHPEVYSNLDGDPLIPDALKGELLQQLLTVDPTETCIDDKGQAVPSVVNKVLSFCQSHQLCGGVQVQPKDSVLGHVMPRKKVENILASVVSPK